MKKIINISLLLLVMTSLFSCFDENKQLFDKVTLVEFQDAVVNSPALGKTFPILASTNAVQTKTLRINLVGAQRDKDEVIKFSVDPAESNAVAGTHYDLAGATTITIPAKSSFGELKVNILKAPAQAGQTATVVFVLEGNGSDIGPNNNYKKVGYRITL
ncbi:MULTISPECIES: DUF4843 domain-containing protein [unclassified Arcicella]|uniref:DUF4843 domain-containing protein n=1 Tax=unclassified Arcicella TaxID=2644986 RepID=UPI0028543F56|nr:MULTISPECIES: DUF4843 domain-containing protein [unclassified Arcicella]MDR6560807.1 hypothetical protein [Arcicella sp. BE51]MDR6810691.1 hypothetical protein [Arcicella sp. BE140]MDR6822041.1 hypothetical protein [Arcicella sp. BE139]